ATAPKQSFPATEDLDSADGIVPVGYGNLIRVMAGTGMRIGEACALRWEDVDLANGTAYVHATLVRHVGAGLVIQESTQTNAGAGTVHMLCRLCGRLRARLDTSPVTEYGVVRPTPLGSLRDIAYQTKRLRVIFDGAGLTWATSHTLRRTAATMLDEAGLSARD